MFVRSLGFRTDLALLALDGTSLEDRETYTVVRSPDNPTFHWGNYLLLDAPPVDGPAGLAAAEVAFRAAFPDAKHLALGFDTTDGVLPDADAYPAAGWTVGRDAVMTATAATLRPPPRPNGAATCRPLASDADWMSWRELMVSQGDEPSDAHLTFLATRVASMRRRCEAGHGAWFGAFVEGRLGAGLGIFAAGDATARYQEVNTHRDLRRRGLAGTLVQHAGHWAFEHLAARELVMVADPADVAIRLYRTLGFTEGETQLGVSRT